MENDKKKKKKHTAQGLFIYDRSVFILHNNHEIQMIITVSMCLLRKLKSENKLL